MNWEERNKFLAKRFFVRKWFMQVKKMKQRDAAFESALKEIDKKLLSNSVNTIADIGQTKKLVKAVSVARAADFFTQLRKIWGDWDKVKRRILGIMGKYLESEDEKRINYLRRKLLQWKDNAKLSTKEAAMNRIAKWTENRYKIGTARNSWKELSGKYDMYVNKSYLFQLKSRLRNWLKLRSMAFMNWEERNKFLAKRFFVRKWFMQVKKMKQRDAALESALNVFDKQLLSNSVNTLGGAIQVKRISKAADVARAVDFFTQLRKIWGDWDKVRRKILGIMGKYLESEDEKRINYLKRKLLQWKPRKLQRKE